MSFDAVDNAMHTSLLPMRWAGARKVGLLGNSEAWAIEAGNPVQLEIWFDPQSSAVLGWHDLDPGEAGCERMYAIQMPPP